MNMHDILQKSDSELHTLLQEMRTKLTELRHTAANGKLTEVHTIQETRNTIARIHTALAQRAKQSMNEQ